MDMKRMVEMANQLREQMTEAQNKARAARYQGEAGGGLVKVTVNGKFEVLDVQVDPRAVDPDDATLLQDLIKAAFNVALRNVSEGMQNQLGGMAQGMGVDLSALGLDPSGGEAGGEK